ISESEFQEGNNDDRRKTKENFKKGMEELLEKMEKLTVHATWIVYDCIAIRTNPDLTNAMQHLEVVFLRCKEEMEKQRQKVLME
ncbi:SYCE3 protein, partial [Dyaphorophyia castanea]|nr:SYCE3 protein [Platysteira castanea]